MTLAWVLREADIILTGVFLGYFVVGEWFLGTVCGLGRQHRYPWERKR